MNRRSFIGGLAALVGGIALEQAVPLGRVWSFPSEIKCLNAEKIGIYSTYTLGKEAFFSIYYPTLYYDQMSLDRLADFKNGSKFTLSMSLTK